MYHVFLNTHFDCNLERIFHLYMYHGSLYNHICHTLVHTFLLRNVRIFASTRFPCEETHTLHSHILRISENTCSYCSSVRICYYASCISAMFSFTDISPTLRSSNTISAVMIPIRIQKYPYSNGYSYNNLL